jgi:hypothetical protein
MSTGGSWAIFINGSYGVGKSSTLEHVGDLLADAGQPFSLMDVDWYHRSWPPADSQRGGNKAIETENMAAAWANYLSVGPRQLVISGVIASRDDLNRYTSALGLTVRPIRLVASPETTDRRLQGRYTETQQWKVDWHIQRHRELSRRLDDAGLDEAVIDTDGRRPIEVAEAVLMHFGYHNSAANRRAEP